MSDEFCDEIEEDAAERMAKSLDALRIALGRLRTGRASPSLVEHIEVEYYGVPTPLKQAASISVEEGRTLVITPWERSMISPIEKALLDSDLGITPQSSSDLIRLPLPPLTEEGRRDLTRKARAEAEQARVSIRNVRRDANNDLRHLGKDKLISEDDERRAEVRMQQLTDKQIAQVDEILHEKEHELSQF